jgi:hypothetical protein
MWLETSCSMCFLAVQTEGNKQIQIGYDTFFLFESLRTANVKKTLLLRPYKVQDISLAIYFWSGEAGTISRPEPAVPSYVSTLDIIEEP